MAKLSDFPEPVLATEVVEPDWEAGPCGVTRDSDPLTKANFEALCDRYDAIDPYGDHWEICRFAHFSAGWLELIFVRPGSKVAALNPAIRDEMAGYPCLDEALWIKFDEAACNSK